VPDRGLRGVPGAEDDDRAVCARAALPAASALWKARFSVEPVAAAARAVS
jgi:hypothetical protein